MEAQRRREARISNGGSYWLHPTKPQHRSSSKLTKLNSDPESTSAKAGLKVVASAAPGKPISIDVPGEDYEQRRETNIIRNSLIMANLGLANDACASKKSEATAKQSKKWKYSDKR